MDINLPVNAPVNNNIQSTIYDKLDQLAFEKIRVANSQLDSRLSIQEKILKKHRQDIERIHSHQKERLKREVRKIREKRPDYVYDDNDASTTRSRAQEDLNRKRCLSEPLPNLSYCRRFYSHHYNIGTEKKKDTDEANNPQRKHNDFFNMGFRLYFINIMKVEVNAHRNTDSAVVGSNPEDDLAKSMDSSLTNSPRRLDSTQYNAWMTDQSSVDDRITDGEDDVFGLSHSSFRPNLQYSKSRHSLACLTEQKETDAGERKENKKKDVRKRHSEDCLGKVRRRKSKVTHSDIVKYNNGLRESKHDFEKLFSGFL